MHDLWNIKRITSDTIKQRGDIMPLPYLSEVQNASKKYTVMFRGLNYGEGTQDGEFAETLNLSTDLYPCITQRAKRIEALIPEYKNPTTLHSKGHLLVICNRKDGSGLADVYYDGETIGEVEEEKGKKKQTATVGDYIVIFPDKKYYNVATKEFGNMEIKYPKKGLKFEANKISFKTEFKSSWLTFAINSITIGKEYKAKNFRFTANTIEKSDDSPNFMFEAGDIVTIAGAGDHNKTDIVVKEATAAKLTFEDKTFSISGTITITNEVTITKRIESFPFVAGDKVTIAGSSYENRNKKDIEVIEATVDKLTFADNTFSVLGEEGNTITITKNSADSFPFEKGDSVTISGCSVNGNNKSAEIIIRGVTNDELTFDDNTFTEIEKEENEVTISRTVPDLTFICENNYRLWGTDGNSICASKFGDPINFKSFEGLAGDSYSIEVGSEGDFTGCIPYASHICFFKENTLHKLYGTKPSNYQITTVNVYGVQNGSEKSMQIVNEQLLYKGVGGIYSYTGGVPELISEKFGTKRFSDAVACCDGEKYYISMKDNKEKYSMFTYDVLKNIWLREDDTHAVDMAFHNGKVYYLDAENGLYYIDKTADRSDIEWQAQFCTINETMNERKGYSKFHLRMDLDKGAWLAVDIKTDNEPQWKQIYSTHNSKAKTVSIPIMPTRCDSVDIRLRGKGKCTIKTFIREFTVGSDV